MSKIATLQFKFDNFADLPTEVDHFVDSKVQIDCNGNKWNLGLYPGGRSDATEKGYSELYLFCKNEQLSDNTENTYSVDTKFCFYVMDASGSTYKHRNFEYKFNDSQGFGSRSFMQRSEILDEANNILKDGTLTIHVTIQVKVPQNDLHYPTSRLATNMLELLESENAADISFKIGDKTLKAHSLIINANAPILFNCCNKEGNSPTVIDDTNAEVFAHILKNVYAEIVPPKDFILEWDEELIDAANKYGLVGLKESVENVLVQERILNFKNVADYLLFADAMSCPLLKEYTISFFLLHTRKVLNCENSKKLLKSSNLVKELMLELAADKSKGSATVTELRQELPKPRLDDWSNKVLGLNSAKRQRTE